MEFGLGLPINDPALLPAWARLAEQHDFATLALLDRLTFDNPEPLIALAVLAGGTDRIRLQTEVLLGPLRSTALLAKQVATLDRMSGGRFVLGIGIGGREDDHEAAGVPLAGRGRLLDAQLADLRRIWRGEPYRAATTPDPRDRSVAPDGAGHPLRHRRAEHPGGTETAGPGGPDGAGRPGGSGVVSRSGGSGVAPSTEDDWGLGRRVAAGVAGIGPRPVAGDGPPILIGGFAPAALRRVARFADGFICAAPLGWAGGLVRTVNEQWEEAGRAGRPRLVCQINVSVGDAATVERGRRAVADYYAFTGRPGFGVPLSDPGEIAEAVAAYREFGADELVFYCYADDPRQIDILAGILR
ncbi:Alkanesulfonate monooxygenase [Actinoplanes sp. SE50]|nr:Alkanesulfonate monooxygenase [Actinoplanes sp. SE50/110]ATO80455.1 Alkanesulfonate monooxygenase [Actinoplanes sp. SE50]SLL97862.1 Limonene 1,2-monooxygenase [Actinoplanes sp. SE50/110]